MGNADNISYQVVNNVHGWAPQKVLATRKIQQGPLNKDSV